MAKKKKAIKGETPLGKPKVLTADDIYPAPPKRTGFISRVRDVLFFPYDFFENLGKSRNLEGSIGFLLSIALIPAAYSSIAYFLSGSAAKLATLLGGSPHFIVASLGALQYFTVVFTAILGVLGTHLLVRLFGGRAGISMTFKTAVYAGTPWFLFLVDPLLFFFGLFWSVYLEVVGLKKTQGIGTLAAIVATVVPILVGFGILLAYFYANPQILAAAGNI
jgi:hypothetical protein